MKHNLKIILMMHCFVKIASLKKLMLAATIMLAAVFAVQAATYTVTNVNDSSAGSLRDAINQANASAANDTITFAAGANGTITLLSALPNLSGGSGDLTISGNGTANTIISGNNLNNRIFTFFINATINGLTLRDSDGGAILHYNRTVTVNDVVITNNISNANGSAITSVNGNLYLDRVTVTNNTGPNGTGIYVQGGNLNVTDSTFSGNSGGTGDVIRMNPSSLGITSTLTMVNSTISGNSSTFNNAAITLQTGSNAANVTVANLTNCTITNNSTTGTRGAIWLQPGVGTRVLNLRNTIVSGNLSGGAPFDIEGTAEASSSFNLIGTGGGLTNGVNSNIVGVNNPQLLPLATNGGTTLTHALLASSPALDQGFNYGVSSYDQRGNRYERTFDYPAIAPATGGDNTDIGAVEQRAYTVTKTADIDDSVCDTDCSLREAIAAANANPANDTITFAPAANGTITLASALPNLANNGSLMINGNGAVNTVISGNNAVTPLTVNGGANVTLSGLTVTNGNAPGGFGGAIRNSGTLTVTDSMLSDSAASNSGGAIANFGLLTVTDSTLSGNSAARGGAIYLQDATAILTNTTINGNTATNGAGAISNLSGATRSGSLMLISCTVTGNTGTSTGGVSAFDNGGSANVTTTIKNTIIANNANPQLSQSGANAHLISQGYNLTSDNGSGLLTGTGDQINSDPLLGPLADNGGPTLTHALLPGSPALDKGNSFSTTTDQRGLPRPFDQLEYSNAADGTDIGAIEMQVQVPPPDSDGDGVPDINDNCPDTSNTSQANFDGDAQGDACDADDDNDNVLDINDAFQLDPNESVDTDGDGMGNNADTDDDNDGQSDGNEIACGSNPLSTASKSSDSDGDNIPDCVEPTVTITSPSSGAVYQIGSTVNFAASFTDNAGDTHTAQWTFSSNGNSFSQVGTVNEVNKTVGASYTFNSPGVYLISLSVTDNSGNSATATTVNNDLQAMVVIYDPNGGFVTGGGWIDSPLGAYRANLSLTGKASFGFVSKYHNGAQVPSGNTEFQFKAANFNFKSTSYEWLVIAGAKAQYKGLGTINGSGDYGFMLTAIDGERNGGGGVDKFRLKIWDKQTGGIVYDNQVSGDTGDNATPSTALGGGSIVIHKP